MQTKKQKQSKALEKLQERLQFELEDYNHLVASYSDVDFIPRKPTSLLNLEIQVQNLAAKIQKGKK